MFKVTNNNGFDFIGRYNGQDYAFPDAMPVYIDDTAAMHIFGLGLADKTSVLARHGWAGPTKTYRDGMQILNRFAFESVHQQLDAPLARAIMEQVEALPPEDHGPAPVIQDAPVVEAGADEPVETAGVVADAGAATGRKRGGRATDPAA